MKHYNLHLISEDIHEKSHRFHDRPDLPECFFAWRKCGVIGSISTKLG